MGVCWSSSASVNQSPSTTANNFSSGVSGTTSNGITASSGSTRRQFSASSGGTTNTTATTSTTSTITGLSEPYSPVNGHILPHPNLRIFSFLELKASTKNFRSDNLLGEGGFGKVFKGWIEEKGNSKNANVTVVAVKKLNTESLQGFEEWKSEVQFLGRLSHPNLVKLLGYCSEDQELLLVYEFMQKGSLENHLGLVFLHSSERQVIYRDFKASNILLDGSYNAKISDFGLAKLGPSNSQSHVTTRVMGTNGYAAPEYVATGHLYVKSDVYAFGVVMIEMLTGLHAMDTNRPSLQHHLVDWIKPHLLEKRKLKRIMDWRLESRYPSKASFQIAQLALKCIEIEPGTRPSMKEVMETLEQHISANNETPRESARIRSTRQSTIHGNPQQPLRRHSPLHQRRRRNQASQLPLPA
ncbi:hypothetical protein LIER_18063 [Lithospermum erythrorhizon]|uniref:non-specific serine/threonine protein kinase n=1 Tax=Lithospermum erythrorhizon TaxID=34254 RepID=A0AAV3QF28_LITER